MPLFPFVRQSRWLSLGSVSALLACSAALLPLAAAPGAITYRFGATLKGEGTLVQPSDEFTTARGYGYEPGAKLFTTVHATEGTEPFYFSAAVPTEGNYRVTITFPAGADATVKAELRRLMVEHIAVPAGSAEVSRTFIVNTRTPKIAAVGEIKTGSVRLKEPRENKTEAWAWDNLITLEFNGAHPAVSRILIEPADVPTIFLIGDSTVCDQSSEPYNSWGQMLPRWFKPMVAVANHAESGETYRDSIGRRRLDKMLSVMKPGDWMLMQFGHNDQKQIAAKTGGPFTTYKTEIQRHVEAVRAHGGVPIVVSPMERRGFDAGGKVVPSLKDYAEAARQTAKELGVAFIDLNELSKPFYEALEARGPEYSRKAFAGQDNTHHCNYGSYELSKLIVQALIDQKSPLAKWVVDDFKPFDPAKPDAVEAVAIPPSPKFTNQRPLGDEGR